MKKLSAILCMFMMLCTLLPALGQEAVPEQASSTPMMEAYATLKFLIRDTPDENGRRIKGVEPRTKVSVYGVGTEWCIISHEGVVGYCKTKWLWRFRSLDPFTARVPGAAYQAGIATVVSPVEAKVKGYGGNLLAKGNLLSVTRWENGKAILPMMRSEVEIAAGYLEFSPFIPWDKAEPGDIIGGFTTYFNEKTGGKLAANRQYNIELACRLISGTVLNPNTDFSYNKLCAPYTKANGYRLAPNISRDGSGYGGGVCQLTTTIYNAALGLPLMIKEQALHKESGVAYIPKGFDAAVGSYSDLIFTNLLPYGIHLEALAQNGVLTVVITRAS